MGGLNDPLEVRVQHETYRSMSGTYVQAILSQKNWTGLAGALRNGRNQSKYDFCSVSWPLLVKNPFFLLPSGMGARGISSEHMENLGRVSNNQNGNLRWFLLMNVNFEPIIRGLKSDFS